MSDTKADRPRAVEEMVRQYYAAKGWPDELWAMGFEEAVKFAEHFRREAATLLSQEHTRAEQLERLLSEADAVIAHLYGDFSHPGHRREPHPDWRRHEAEAKERHASRASPKQKE